MNIAFKQFFKQLDSETRALTRLVSSCSDLLRNNGVDFTQYGENDEIFFIEDPYSGENAIKELIDNIIMNNYNVNCSDLKNYIQIVK